MRETSPPGGLLPRIVTADLTVVYLVLGLFSVLSLAFLTPPFQVPDEQQHFFRTYQLSEMRAQAVVQDGAAGDILPSSLPAIADAFLGTSELHTKRDIPASPLLKTLSKLYVPLDPQRREFVNFSGAAFYSPLPYLPQIAAISAGRALGLGPLGLLYAGRLANGLAALLIIALSLRIFPFGNLAIFVSAMLPMTIFEVASVSPDAAIIATTFLFSAIALRARERGFWRLGDVFVASLCGVVFCPLKPVYAPLLVIGLPGIFRRGSSRNVLAAQIVLVITALGTTAIWTKYSLSSFAQPHPGANLPEQLAGMIANPGHFAYILLDSFYSFWRPWIVESIGKLGWLTITLPPVMYVLPAIAGLLGLMSSQAAAASHVGRFDACWDLVLVVASALLVLIAVYLYWSAVGSPVIDGVQGRYFLPLAGLLLATVSAAMPSRLRLRSSTIVSFVIVVVAAEVVMTDIVVMRAYQVF